MAHTGQETSLGQWLRERRKALDITQEELADQIGCARETIKKIELGQRRPSRQIADLLADYFRIPHDERADFTHFARTSAPPSHPPVDSPTATTGEAAAPWREQSKRRTNLPVPPTQLIGREREVDRLGKQLLSERTRLMTLTGSPGIGKTRLALEVAHSNLAGQFEDGVFFVELAPITDAALVPATIFKALGLKELVGRSPLESLKEALHGKRLLLLLDNFEQVIQASSDVADLLAASPWLKVLVTSREALRVRGERNFPVPPLDLPTTDYPIHAVPSVALFIERAQDANPAFELAEENAEAVAAVCVRLEGVPLAIELAAARANLFAPQALLQQLSGRQVLHVGGLRDLPARHQTLRDAIGWSYDLLDDSEKVLFRRLGVFVGGAVLSAAESICDPYGDLPVGLKDMAASLLDKSLLQVHQDSAHNVEPRFTMLETIREYALERLDESGESNAVKRYHMEYFLALAEEAAPHLIGPDQMVWLNRLEAERDNLRAALSIGLSRVPNDQSTPDVLSSWLGLRLAGALGQFWAARGNLSEGRRWLQSAIEISENLQDRIAELGVEAQALARAQHKALSAAGVLARLAADFSAARRFLGSALAISRDLGDLPAVATTLGNLGNVEMLAGEYQEARISLTEALKIRRELGLVLEVGHSLTQLGNAALLEENYNEARLLHEEALEIKRRAGDKQGIGHSLHSLATIARMQGDYDGARRLDEETLAIARNLGNKPGMAYSLRDLGNVALAQGDYSVALRSFLESLVLLKELEDIMPLIDCLGGIARTRARTGHLEYATRLFGAVYAIQASLRSQFDPAERAAYEQEVAGLRAKLDEVTFALAYQEGGLLNLQEVISEVVELMD